MHFRDDRPTGDDEPGRHGEHQQPAKVRVDGGPEDDQRDAEQRHDEKVEHDRADYAAQSPLRRMVSVQRVVQRTQLFVLFAPHNLVCTDDLLAGADLVLRRRNSRRRVDKSRADSRFESHQPHECDGLSKIQRAQYA